MVSKLIIIIMIQRLKTFCLGMAARYDNFKDHKTFITMKYVTKKYQFSLLLSWERNKLS